MEEILDKYSIDCLKRYDRQIVIENLKILKDNNCDYLDDILEDYLDILLIDNSDFKKKFEIINKKYNGEFLMKANEDMNLLEEFYKE